MERPRLLNRGSKRLLTATFALFCVVVGAGAVVYGSVPHAYATGDTLQAADLNVNFAALDQRLAALEAIKPSVKVVMDVVNGPLPAAGKTATFTTVGGIVTLLVSGSGFAANVQTAMELDVSVDGQPIGWLRQFTSEANTHRAFPTRIITVPTLAAGSHTVTIAPTANTSTDGNDWFSATAFEMGR
jgi:hypothetical protein